MKLFEHINFEMRKIISNCLSKKMKAVEIANYLNIDPSAVSKELKRNRIVTKEAPSNAIDPICKKTLRFPYVCNGCDGKYGCKKKQYKYDSKRAQDMADYRLVSSRQGINMTKEEFEALDKKIKDGVLNKNSIYHIVKDSNLNVSVPTVYRYISQGILTTKKMDLPYATSYKKRKKHNKKYEYSQNNRIDRSNRTFLDYLSYTKRHPNLYCVQMDFLGSIITDSKSILTLIISEIHFVILFIIDSPNSSKIDELFDYLENRLGSELMNTIFPLVLTDRDPSFSDFEGIEFNRLTGVYRTNIFYCDSFKSNQKGSVENMNKQLRKYFPKGTSINHLTQADVTPINEFINNQKIHSLSGFSPKEAFIKIYGEEAYNLLSNAIASYNK